MMKNTVKLTSMIAAIYLFTGYQELSAQTKDSLKEKQIEEVVMIGYGSAKKRDLTGSITKIGGSEVADKPNSNPVASLQGKVAGLSVTNSGQPGQTPDIRIRGTLSRYKTSPLYVVDGLWAENLDFVNPNDIESMEILKDASSLAIFGNRGANGVILVTTKKGKTGKATVNFNSSVGFKFMTDKPEMANATEFKQLYDLSRVNQGLSPYGYYNIYTANTDWVDAITNNGAVVTNNNVSFSSATEKNKLYLGLGHLYEEGIIRDEKMKKVLLSFNDEYSFSKNFKVGFQFNGAAINDPILSNYSSALASTPIVAPFNDAQNMYNQLPAGLGDAQLGNAVLGAYLNPRTNISNTYRFVGNIYAEIKFLKDFTFKTNWTGNMNFNRGRGYRPVTKVWVNESNTDTFYGGNTLTSVYQNKSDEQYYQVENYITWSKNFGGHSVTAMAGHTFTDGEYSKIGGTIKQYANGAPIPFDSRFWYLNVTPFGDPSTATVSSEQYNDSYKSISYFGRVMYNYNGKYILNASYRRDGSANFSVDNPNLFQNFWAVGAAWDLGKEDFFKVEKINSLKLKGSFGQLGNKFVPGHYLNYPGTVVGAAAPFNGELNTALESSYLNSNIHWETLDSYEGGLELSAFSNKLKFEGVYYIKKSKDLLNFVESSGQKFFINNGSIRNNGLELSASWNQKLGENFSYNIGGNLTTINNKVLSTYDNQYFISGNSWMQTGFPMGYFVGYVVDGVYQSYADVLSSPASTVGSYGPGDLKFKDLNGDGVINDKDRTIIGNPTPDFTYGINLGLNYRNWYFNADFQGVYGNEVWRGWGNGSSYAQFNYRKDRLQGWNGAGTSNWEPIVNDGNGYNQTPSTYMIEDGSYFRIRNVQLGYNFNKDFANQIGLSSLKIYVNAQNLYTWKNNSGFTPEAGGTPTEFGVDGGGYPLPLIATMGVNVSF